MGKPFVLGGEVNYNISNKNKIRLRYDFNTRIITKFQYNFSDFGI